MNCERFEAAHSHTLFSFSLPDMCIPRVSPLAQTSRRRGARAGFSDLGHWSVTADSALTATQQGLICAVLKTHLQMWTLLKIKPFRKALRACSCLSSHCLPTPGGRRAVHAGTINRQHLSTCSLSRDRTLLQQCISTTPADKTTR